MSDQRQKLNDQFIASLMGRYDMTIEDVPINEKPDVLKEHSQETGRNVFGHMKIFKQYIQYV